MAIQISNLAFSYGKIQVLDNISMQLVEGKIYGLLGENGVGKTTLLTLLCGLKKPQSGEIITDSYVPYAKKPGFLANQYFLPDDAAPLSMKAEDYARLSGSFYPNFDMGKFQEIMHLFETDPSKKMDKMSTGQLKKTYISFALAINVKYLFMDEPTNGLDIPSKSQFRSAITKYTADDSTIVISTHQIMDLENLIDPIIIMSTNEVLLNASLQQISEKLFFDYSNVPNPNAIYTEQILGGTIQVCPNLTGAESKVHLEVLFNTIHAHKDLVVNMFNS